MKENSSPSLHPGRETEKNLHQEGGSRGRSPADRTGAAPDWVHVAPKAPGASTEPSGTPHFPKKLCSQIRAALIRKRECAQCCLLWQQLPLSSLINWGWWVLSSPEIRGDCVISGPFPPLLPRLGLPWHFFINVESKFHPHPGLASNSKSVFYSQSPSVSKSIFTSHQTWAMVSPRPPSTWMRDPCPSSPATSRKASTPYSNLASRTYG